MDTKLTLKLDKEVIERAKRYAAEHQISLSRVVEQYLDYLTAQNAPQGDVTPLVQSLSGIIQLDADYDHRADYANYLEKKYR